MPIKNPRTKSHFGRSRYASKWKKGQYEKKYSLVRQPVTGPDRIFRKLRYYRDDLELVPTSGPIVGNVFSLNGMFDPDVTGAGNQPRGFDQYCSTSGGLYKNYVILGARVIVKFMNLSSSTYSRATLKISRANTIDSDPIDTLEKRYQRNAILAPSGSGQCIKTLSMKWSAKKWFGKSTVMTEKDLEGDNGSNPTTECFLHVGVDGMGTASAGARCIVNIDYLVCFRTPTIPQQS